MFDIMIFNNVFFAFTPSYWYFGKTQGENSVEYSFGPFSLTIQK